MRQNILGLLLIGVILAATMLVEGDSSAFKGTIFGHVFDTKSGNPILSAMVRYDDGKDGIIGLTDAEGRYSINGGFAPSTSYTLTCYASGYPEAKKTLITDPQGNAEANFRLESQPPVVTVPKVQSDDVITKSADPEYRPNSDIAAQNLEGTWILNTDESQILMALYQSENLLFGAAKSEAPVPWNGLVNGSISGNEVQIQILSLRDGALVSTIITASAGDGTLEGRFVQSDTNGRVKDGTVIAIMFSTETSGYQPAIVPREADTIAEVGLPVDVSKFDVVSFEPVPL
jgi:hypothetical protein